MLLCAGTAVLSAVVGCLLTNRETEIRRFGDGFEEWVIQHSGGFPQGKLGSILSKPGAQSSGGRTSRNDRHPGESTPSLWVWRVLICGGLSLESRRHRPP